MIRYYADGDATRPVPVECHTAGYPYRDAEGRTQYDNSHFDTEAEAWDRLLREHKAAVKLDARAVREAEARLAEHKDRLVAATLRLTDTEAAHRAWQEAQDGR